MTITIGGIEYDLGYLLEYAQTNDDGAYQDKLKYRLAQQNNLFVAICKALAAQCAAYDQTLAGLITSYPWTYTEDNADNLCADADGKESLYFYTYSTALIEELDARLSALEDSAH